jgi:hypothetical protein
MGDCKTSCINCGIIKDWCGALREFTSLLRKPAAPPRKGLHRDEALSKWFVFATQAEILRNLVIYPVLAFALTAVLTFVTIPKASAAEGEEAQHAEMMVHLAQVFAMTHAINGVFTAFYTWIGNSVYWYLLCRREPIAICCCPLIIEGWKHSWLLYGILGLWRPLFSPAYLSVHVSELFLADVLGAMGIVYVSVRVVLAFCVEITYYFLAISLFKVGMKKSGCTVYGDEKSEYDPETVGQPVRSAEIKTGEIKINFSAP